MTPHPEHPAGSVLVTGATGLVGRALVRSLAQSGIGVIALSRDVARARTLLGGPGMRCVNRLDELPHDIVIDAVAAVSRHHAEAVPSTRLPFSPALGDGTSSNS